LYIFGSVKVLVCVFSRHDTSGRYDYGFYKEA